MLLHFLVLFASHILFRPVVLADLKTTLDNAYTWVKALGLGACVLGLAYGGFLVIVHSGSEDVRAQARGKKVILASLVGGGIVALAQSIGSDWLTNVVK